MNEPSAKILACAQDVSGPLNMNMAQLAQTLSTVMSRPIAFHRIFVGITGSVTAGVMLSQMWYLKDTPTVKARGEWFWRTRDEWMEETGLSRTEQEHARKVLRDLGFISEEKKDIPPKIYTTIHSVNIVQAIISYTQATNPLRDTNLQETCQLYGRKPAKYTAGNLPNNTESSTESSTDTKEKDIMSEVENPTPDVSISVADAKKKTPKPPKTKPTPEDEAFTRAYWERFCRALSDHKEQLSHLKMIDLSKYVKGTANLLVNFITSRFDSYENAKIPDDLTKWAEAMDKLQRIDKISPQRINDVMDVIFDNGNDIGAFWGTNVEGVPKLRVRFARLEEAIEKAKAKGRL